MKITGLIAEYNPFHNGHQYHIEKARELTGADAIVVVMSGDFVQRGTPAIMPKHLRTQMALEAGADLVIELPVYFATGSAEIFAYGAVSLLNQLGCIDAICFGSECGDLQILKDLAEILSLEPKKYKEALGEHLRQGNSFPLARQKAMADYLGSNVADSILSEPNNILGIEYLKALRRLLSTMIPYTIPRISSHYHDIKLQETYSSASAIRNEIQNTEINIRALQEQMTPVELSLLRETHQKRYPVFANDFSLLLKYQLLSEDKASLMNYADVSEDLANRMINHRNQYVNFEQYCDLLKTKELTYSRISRALLHILLHIHKETNAKPEYAHILGFHKTESDLFATLKKSTSIPLLSKLSATDTLSTRAQKMLDTDIFASNLYESVIAEKYHTSFIHELEKQIVRV